MSDYDDDYGYDDEDDYEDDGYDDYDAGPHYYDPISDAPLMRRLWWRFRWWGPVARIERQIDNARRWLKWHNHKCKVCGKPATMDGVTCPACHIPF